MKFLLSILVIIGNLNVLLANNDNCRENDLNALIVRGLRTDFDKQKNVLEDQKAEIEDLRQEINNTSSELKELRQNTSSELAEIKESMRNMTEVVGNIIKDLEESTSGLDNLKVVTDEINKKCEDGLSDLSKNLERQTNDLRSSSTESIKNVSEVVVNIKKDVEKSTSRLDDLKTVTDEIKEQMEKLDQATEKKT
ncbi:uncharacterized protein R10E11.5-like, partial [Ruditapes philippinarum]|uniref:uncharacterized protein R10E11.5-like n=1 Tax=Ruditapes philippinarum TaxID=129788 RepID=UPI00295AA643